MPLPPGRMPTKELEKKVAEAKRSSVLLHALQDRLEELLIDSPEVRKAEEEAGYVLREEYDELVTQAEALTDRNLIHHKATVVHDSLKTLAKADEPHLEVFQRSYRELLPPIQWVKEEAVQYPDDDHCRDHVDRINRAVMRFQQLIVESERKTRPSSSVAEKASTVESETKSKSRPVTSLVSRLKLDLPRFNGEPTEWLGFKALFTANIERDGSDITEHEKIMHLLSCMTSIPARQTVKQFSTSTDGYTQAKSTGRCLRWMLAHLSSSCQRLDKRRHLSLQCRESETYAGDHRCQPQGIRSAKETPSINFWLRSSSVNLIRQ